MKAAGYVFLAGGALLFRQIAVGRASETPADIRDIVTGLLNGDMDSVKSTLSQRGSNVDSTGVAGVVATASASVGSTPLIAEVMRLGNAAKGYHLGGTGPEYFDCSGLIWRACKNLDIYNGPRFTTHTFQAINRSWTQPVRGPQAGAIVLWAGRHMGICLGGDRMYSARSTEKGIGESSITGDSGYFGKEPSYWMVTNA